ncbi:hypothetical protein [Kordiimonas sp.]|uniref:hypothetical protein n=1 Tax=Kordiimonas sp. TaxID=1970157 RepID=UPI003A8CD983
MTELCFRPIKAATAQEFDLLCTGVGAHFRPLERGFEAPVSALQRVNDRLPLFQNAVTKEWLDRYFRFQSSGTTRLGVLEARGALVHDDWGLTLSKKAQVAGEHIALSSLHGFGWEENHLGYMARNGFLAMQESGSYRLDDSRLERRRLEGRVALLSFPGVHTYGHWIVDVAARLELLNATEDLHAIDAFLMPTPAPWMLPFLAAYGVPSEKIVPLDKTTVFEMDRLLMPTTLSQHEGGVVPIGFAGQIFRRLGDISSTWGRTPPRGKPVPSVPIMLIEHTAMTSKTGRELENADALKSLILEMGGEVANPLKITLSALLMRLRHTKLALGLDSSALHNLAMAPCDLIAIQTAPRFNMLHPSIQEATGKRVGFIQADETPSGWQVDLQAMKAMIREAHG